MSKLNISFASACSKLIALLVLFIICISTTNVDGLANYQYDDNDGELKNLLIPDSSILWNVVNRRSDLPLRVADYDSQYGQMHIIPYKKRTIPIELQKALYAHGIVGRRR